MITIDMITVYLMHHQTLEELHYILQTTLLLIVILGFIFALQNGTTPETPDGKPSLDEPTFTDLEPRELQVHLETDIFGNTYIV